MALAFGCTSSIETAGNEATTSSRSQGGSVAKGDGKTCVDPDPAMLLTDVEFTRCDGSRGFGTAHVKAALQACEREGQVGCLASDDFRAVIWPDAEAVKAGTTVGPTAGAAAAVAGDCARDGERGCVASPAWPAVDAAAVPTRLIEGATVGAVGGDVVLPPAGRVLVGAAGAVIGTLTLPPVSAVRAGSAPYGVASRPSTPALQPDFPARSAVRTSDTVDGQAGLLADCATNAAVGCFANTTYRAADLTNVTPTNLKASVVVAGQTGIYPSASAPLAGSDATPDLTTATFDAQMADGVTSFEWFDGNGTRHARAGDSDLRAANVKSGATMLGVGGGLYGVSASDEWNLRTGTTFGSVQGKIRTNCRNGGDTAVFDISMPLRATAAADDTFTFSRAHGWATGTAVRISYRTAPTVGATPLNATTTYFVIAIDGTTVKLAANATDATNGTALDLTGVGAGVTVFRWQDGTLGLADTIDDYDATTTNGARIASTPWGAASTPCGGLAATAADANVWLDVTTSGGAASSCAAASANCSLKDKITGLTWSKSFGQSAPWSWSMASCAALSVDGVSGWRAPTMKEVADAYVHGARSVTSGTWLTASNGRVSDVHSATTASGIHGYYAGLTLSVGDGGALFSKGSTDMNLCVR